MQRISLSIAAVAAAASLVLIGLTASSAAAAEPAQDAKPSSPAATSAITPRKTPAYIMLKLDDLRQRNGKVDPRWQPVVDYLKAQKIKASIGIICDSLEGDHPEYVRWIKEQQATGLFEFWDHGYDHKEQKVGDKTIQEFKGATFEQQRDHLLLSEKLAKEKLGFALPAFGAPFNGNDENTVKALQECPDVKVWIYGDAKNPAGKVVLDRIGAVNIENPIFHPDCDKFIAGYNRYPNRAYFVIQGHPWSWDAARLAQFVKIVDFLKSQGAIFTTPSEYARTISAGTTATP